MKGFTSRAPVPAAPGPTSVPLKFSVKFVPVTPPVTLAEPPEEAEGLHLLVALEAVQLKASRFILLKSVWLAARFLQAPWPWKAGHLLGSTQPLRQRTV